MPHPLTVVLSTLLLVAITWIPYDIWLIEKYGVKETISWTTLQFAINNPVTVVLVGFALSILTRHLFTDRTVSLFSFYQPFFVYVLATLAGWLLGSWWVQRGG